MQYFNRQINVKLSIFGVLLFLTILSSTILSSSISSADTEKQSDATVTVGSACTMFRESTVPHVISVGPSSYREDVGTTRLKTVCNDTNGYAIYAIGYSNDTDGDTNMYGEEHSLTIPTGIETGDVSNWSMKLSKDLNAYNPENLTITPAFTSYAPVPSTQTKVASFEGATDTTDGSIVETTYAIRVSSSQLADTYTGQVKYTMVHPADGRAPGMMAIQDVTADNCPTTPTVVYDNRDDEEYTIQKLADGNCWLLDNLRLDLTDSDVQANLTSNTTNASDATLGYLKNGGGTASDQYAMASVIEWTGSTSYSAPLTVTTSIDSTGSGGYEAGKYGAQYNYCAATAGSYCYGDGTDPSNTSDDATEDICPKGWRMPTGGAGGEYEVLYTKYNSVYADFVNGLRIPLAGYAVYGSILFQGSSGSFWSSTRSSSTLMYGLSITETKVSPQNEANRGGGKPVRCLSEGSGQEGESGSGSGSELDPSKTYIQDVTLADCPSEPTVVFDKRDNNGYTIQKLADGNCWLLDNLRLDPATLTTTLTPENTNMDPNTAFTLPSSSNSGFSNYTTPQINSDNKNVEQSYGDGDGKLGVYYNYCAATAGTACGDGWSTTIDASYDICPAGWRLPTGNSQGEFKVLYSAYSENDNAFRNAFHTVYPGYGANYVGTTLQVWSSQRGDNYNSYTLEVTPSMVNTNKYGNRQNGFSIRCIAKEPEVKTYIQDVTPSTCPTTPTTVYDNRDEETYVIQKLADGKCWMLENLRLDPTTVKVDLTTANTNKAPNVPFALPASTGGGFNSYTIPQVNTAEKNNTYTYGDGENKAGVYYNYCAASAGTACGDSVTGNSGFDICPKGWHLPSAGSDSDYSGLYAAYNNDYTVFRNAFRATLGGWIRNSSTTGKGTNGYFWSNTYGGGDGLTMYSYDAYSSYTQADYSDRNSGFSIRCVAFDNPIVSPTPELEPKVTFIQDVTLEECSTTPTTVYDNRDYEMYTIQKLADGNCWLLENLRLDPTTLINPLTTDNTNMSPDVDFALPTGTSAQFNAWENEYYEIPQLNTQYKDTIPSYSLGRSGVYYNYCAVSAGTYCHEYYAEGDSNAYYDICPKGWRMPKEFPDSEGQALYDAYENNTTAYNNAIRAVFAGYPFVNGQPNSAGRVGYYWTTSIYGSNDMFIHYSESESAGSNPTVATGFISRLFGANVRCIAKNGNEPETMTHELDVPHDIQDVTPATCPGTPTTVYDSRDGSAYTIQKLADGNCWMLDNLNLGRRTVKVLTPDDTNISSNFTLPGSVSTGFDDYQLAQINIDSRNDTTSYGSGENKIGVYYNYCAATAGTYCQPQSESSGIPTEDICPKGWRLPTGGETGEYQKLYEKYSTYSDFKNALHASLSGYFKYSQNNHQGSYGSFWSSTPVGDDRIYSLDVRRSSVPNDFTSYRTAGLSIRCIAYGASTPHDIQDVTMDTCPAAPTTVYDNRDGEAYTIQRLADGRCWMLENLRLGSDNQQIQLTNQNTNLTTISSFTLPASSITDSITTAQINTDSKNTVTSNSITGKVGVKYNYCAATAGTICEERQDVPTAANDICPKGWRMSTGSHGGEYKVLYEAYNNNQEAFGNAFRVVSESDDYKSMVIWASTSYKNVYGSTYFSDAMYYGERVDVLSYHAGRGTGYAVRCILKEE